jgi:hypothetical protein
MKKLMSLKQAHQTLIQRHNSFKKDYQPRTNIVKDLNGDLFVDFHNILNKWSNYFCHLLNVHGINDVRQTEMYTTKPLVPRPTSSDV